MAGLGTTGRTELTPVQRVDLLARDPYALGLSQIAVLLSPSAFALLDDSPHDPWLVVHATLDALFDRSSALQDLDRGTRRPPMTCGACLG